GDFYVYRTANAQGEFVVPRIAIRMENECVAEVRGIGSHQHVENQMVPAATAKLAALPGGDRYQQATEDMRRMTRLDTMTMERPDVPLSNEDLRFLYEVDRAIQGFGYRSDPRIESVQSRRDRKADLASVFNVTPDRISLNEREAFNGNIRYHHGDL